MHFLRNSLIISIHFFEGISTYFLWCGMEPNFLESRRGWLRTRVGYGAAWRPHLHDSRRGRLRTRTCSRRGWLRTRVVIFFGAAWRQHLLEAYAACTLVFVCLFSRFVTVFFPSFYRPFAVFLPSFYRLCFEIDLQRSKGHVRGRGNY